MACTCLQPMTHAYAWEVCTHSGCASWRVSIGMYMLQPMKYAYASNACTQSGCVAWSVCVCRIHAPAAHDICTTWMRTHRHTPCFSELTAPPAVLAGQQQSAAPHSPPRLPELLPCQAAGWAVLPWRHHSARQPPACLADSAPQIIMDGAGCMCLPHGLCHEHSRLPTCND